MKALGVEDLNLLGEIAKLEKQRENLGTIIEKISNGKSLSQEDSTSETKVDIKVASTFVILSNFYNNLNTYPLNALILQNENLRIKIEGLKKKVANAEKRLSLTKQKKNAIEMEIKSLHQAKLFLLKSKECGKKELITYFNSKAKPDKKAAAQPKQDTKDVAEPVPNCQENIGRALLYYANSWSIGRLIQEETEYLLDGISHKEILEDSEIAMAQWNNMLSVPISQLATLHGAGITSEELANFGLGIVNLAGLTAIAIRVD